MQREARAAAMIAASQYEIWNRALRTSASSKDGKREFLGGKATPRADELHRLVVRQRVGARGPRGLHIELLKHLHGEHDVPVRQQACALRVFAASSGTVLTE